MTLPRRALARRLPAPVGLCEERDQQRGQRQSSGRPAAWRPHPFPGTVYTPDRGRGRSLCVSLVPGALGSHALTHLWTNSLPADPHRQGAERVNSWKPAPRSLAKDQLPAFPSRSRRFGGLLACFSIILNAQVFSPTQA